jgi:radical SAM protein with 4Fe4S-binding SPASM domain
MNMEMFQKIIDQLSDFPDRLKKIELYFFGEPLCNPLLPDMLAYARKKDMTDTIDFTTNGLLFTKERVDQFIEKGMPDTIRISLQGISEEAYSRYCGAKINFGDFLDNLKYLYQNKGNCKISMKVADIAIKDVDHGKEKFEEIFGNIADTLFVESIIPIYGDVNYEEVDTTIKDKALDGREQVKQKKVNIVCHRPFYRLALRTNGDVTAACCDQLHDVKYGNINDNSLIEIWNGKKRIEFLKMMLKGDRFKHPYCKDCIMPNDITTDDDLLDLYADDILRRF